MGCGSSSPGAVVTPQQATVVAGPQQGAVQYPLAYPPQQQVVNRGYPQQHGPPPGYYNQRAPVGYGTPGVIQQPQTVVVQNRDTAGDFIVGMAAGAALSNAFHGPHHYGYGPQIHVHDHDHFHDGGDHYHEHHHYGGPEYHEHYGGDDGGGGFDDGGGFDGGGGFDDGGGFD